MVKSRYLVDFPAQKKEPKWFQNLGRFKKNSSCSVAKKSLKNWTGPCLSLNMVRRNRFIKWQTPSRNVKSSFEGANPTPPTAQCSSGDRLPERRSYHVLWGALDLFKVTFIYMYHNLTVYKLVRIPVYVYKHINLDISIIVERTYYFLFGLSAGLNSSR